VSIDDLVVVAEFKDTIYRPGRDRAGAARRRQPFPHGHQTLENFHAVELLIHHRHAVDAIYIDPPYNTGARMEVQQQLRRGRTTTTALQWSRSWRTAEIARELLNR